jgi:phosphate-selective porin OprO/OprP
MFKFQAFAILFLLPIALFSQEKDSARSVDIQYTSKGFQFTTPDQNFRLQIQSRLQFRYATPGDQNPITFDDFQEDRRNIFKINRARLKVGGHAYRPWLKYYWEYEISRGVLLDFRIMIEKWSFFKVKVGQWKVDYSRERSISSGKQHLVDRSIVNRPFTLDRQQGIAFYGRINPGSTFDFNYWVSILTGNGRGATDNDDKNLMYVGRLQWNLFGREMPYDNSDLEWSEKPVAAISFATATNRSQYTRFSTSGGGSLEGFEDGLAGQYRVNQWLIETALFYKGFSWSQEFHRKMIYDRIGDSDNTIVGNYIDIGYFPHRLISWIPKNTEIAFRHAIYDTNLSLDNATEREVGIAINHFFNEHRNKLTAEVTHFAFEKNSPNEADEVRFRIQWEISF